MLKLSKRRSVRTPERGTPRSAGIDFFVPDDLDKMVIRPGHGVNIPTGIHVAVPEGYALIAFNKSGVAVNKELQVGACVIDEDYQGEVHMHVINVGSSPIAISPGEKLVQFILVPTIYPEIERVPIEELYKEKTLRGTGAFGHTGK